MYLQILINKQLFSELIVLFKGTDTVFSNSIQSKLYVTIELCKEYFFILHKFRRLIQSAKFMSYISTIRAIHSIAKTKVNNKERTKNGQDRRRTFTQTPDDRA